MTVSALAGNWLAEKFVLKTVEGGPGLVPVEAGFGADDVARAITIAVTAVGIRKLWPRSRKG